MSIHVSSIAKMLNRRENLVCINPSKSCAAYMSCSLQPAGSTFSSIGSVQNIDFAIIVLRLCIPVDCTLGQIVVRPRMGKKRTGDTYHVAE